MAKISEKRIESSEDFQAGAALAELAGDRRCVAYPCLKARKAR